MNEVLCVIPFNYLLNNIYIYIEIKEQKKILNFISS